ncbi:Multidrug/Oligosaccharidyl-lipid/Polysaccharide (MOP) Flippase Superfamily [Achlya hypogyna]|uniref:Multidrug/Oligosaccharidyl-lipid/Polysaccharide (MOP) Flippase Superfamily n=1 Tax=Achlya hypogyna TaxID=1202772 RepID=A0A1V9YML5_ACHHY|nr:Multidrug/Oligosaccharidyl-lipid/Polysaccharide (MOP) Flippase Superfamily [Achlya hypogyna]
MSVHESVPLLAKYARSDVAKDEFKHVLQLSGPLVLTAICEYVANSVNAMYTGHLSAESSEVQLLLASNGLAYLFYVLLLYSLAIGVCTALDAMCAQAYGRHAVGDIIVLLQTAVLCSAVLCVPMSLFCIYSTDLLLWLGQPAETAHVTGEMLWYMMFGVPFVFGYEICKRILQSQNVVLPAVLAGVTGNVVNAIAAYLLMFHTSLGYRGSAIAFSLASATYCGVTSYFVYQQDHVEWHGWKLQEAVAYLPQFLSLSLFGWIMFVSEFAGVALTSVLAGFLPHSNLAIGSNNIFLGFRQVFFMVYMGLGVASTVRVGNALGANDPHRAQVAAFQTVGLSASWAVFTSVVMASVRFVYPHLYTEDADTLALAANLMLVNAPFQIVFGVWMVLLGVFRGSAKPHTGAVLNVLFILIVGVPLGWYLAQTGGLGIEGLWLGASIGYIVCAGYGIYWLFQADWKAMALQAQSAHVA